MGVMRGTTPAGRLRAVTSSRPLGQVPDGFAKLWYGMRAYGKRLRAQAAEYLYQHPPGGTEPGGRHPDPDEPVAFGMWTMLQTAAWLMGIEVWTATDSDAHEAEAMLGPRKAPPLAWLYIYPDGRPTIAHHYFPNNDPELYLAICFQMAMLLGDVEANYDRIFDPDNPIVFHVPPSDRDLVAVLHQWAIAFLHLERDCPPERMCDCNRIRARFCYAPPQHAQATDALMLQDFARANGWREKIKPLSAASNREWTPDFQQHNTNPRMTG